MNATASGKITAGFDISGIFFGAIKVQALGLLQKIPYWDWIVLHKMDLIQYGGGLILFVIVFWWWKNFVR